jgi:hypothetical protein
MRILDLVFIGFVLMTLSMLTASAVSAVRGRGASALRILRIYGILGVAYFATGVAFDFFKPQGVIPVDKSWCFDDWCLQVKNVDRASAGAMVTYRVNLRIYSTARRVSQRANGAWIYLIDVQGRRYPPKPDPDVTPISVKLAPEESVDTVRVFEVPAGARSLGLITGHGGPYFGAMSFIIIGGGG